MKRYVAILLFAAALVATSAGIAASAALRSAPQSPMLCHKGQAVTYHVGSCPPEWKRVDAIALRGPIGDTGPVGEQGSQGPAGPKGDTGGIGPQGVKGDTGSQGPQGDTGTRGAGTSFTMVPSGDSEILPNSSLGLTIDCPAGSYAISGGDFAPPGVYVNSEGPVGPTGNPPPVTTDNPKWIVAFDNTTNGSVYVEAYAVCES